MLLRLGPLSWWCPAPPEVAEPHPEGRETPGSCLQSTASVIRPLHGPEMGGGKRRTGEKGIPSEQLDLRHRQRLSGDGVSTIVRVCV